MVPLQSVLVNKEERFEHVRETMESCGFTVGGNWDYEQGSFDCSLDGQNKVWLRIPFKVLDGNFDPNIRFSNSFIKWGTPYVLKHVYQEGVDRTGETGVFSGMFNQFQEPVDEDADVEQEWVDKANSLLNKVEALLE